MCAWFFFLLFSSLPKKKVGVSRGTVGTSPDGEVRRRAGNQEVRVFFFNINLLTATHVGISALFAAN